MDLVKKYGVVFALWGASTVLFADSFDAETGLEGRYFFDEGAAGQAKENVSFRFQPEYHHQSEEGKDSLELIVFARWDQHDDQRSHVDIREFAWTHADPAYELRFGISKVFWGVTESAHLVDIINQTDLVENPDGEEKLGQPMFRFSVERDWGTLDLYGLFFHRAKTYAGKEGRLGLPLEVDQDDILYASSKEDKRVDFAMRYYNYFGNLDMSVSYFGGTSRDPILIYNQNPLAPKFKQLYTTIDQFGLTLQYIWDQLLLKFEGIHRSGQGEAYYAAVGGFEYTQVGLFDTDMDVGWVAEYLYDDRQEKATTPFERDVFLGLRVTLNDEYSTEALVGGIYDPESEETMLSVESSRRLGQNWKATFEARAFMGAKSPGTTLPQILGALAQPDPDNKTWFLSGEDFVQLEFTRYF